MEFHIPKASKPFKLFAGSEGSFEKSDRDVSAPVEPVQSGAPRSEVKPAHCDKFTGIRCHASLFKTKKQRTEASSSEGALPAESLYALVASSAEKSC